MHQSKLYVRTNKRNVFILEVSQVDKLEANTKSFDHTKMNLPTTSPMAMHFSART